MSHYQQQLILNSPPAAVYAALTTLAGLRSWWTQDCDGHPAVGGTLHFRFGPNHKAMRVEHLASQREVRWVCTEAHIAAGQLTRRDEWVGTQLAFRLTPIDAGQTRLDFEHMGLTPNLECYDLCSNGWRYYLASLQQYLESGQGTPHLLASASCAAAQ